MNIYIARHGQDVDNEAGILNGHRDNPLTDLGVSQAEKVAQEIKAGGLSFQVVYSSPLKRAFKTAEIISKISDQPDPVVLDVLIERDFGVMSGKAVSTIEAICAPDIFKTDTVTYFLSPKGAEKFPDLLARGSKVIDFIKENHRFENVLLVCHGDIGKMIYAAFYNLNWQDVLKDFHFGNSEVLHLSENIDSKDAHIFKYEQHNH